MPYPTIRERTKYPIVCQRCGRTVNKLKKNAQFCGRHCASTIRHLNDRSKYHVNDEQLFEALVEANGVCRKRTDKIDHVLRKLNISYQSLCAYMRRIGYRWTLSFGRRPVPAVLVLFKGSICVICGESRNVEIGHLLPACDGGLASPDNLVPLCPSHHVFFDRGLLTQSESENLEYICSKMFPEFSRVGV